MRGTNSAAFGGKRWIAIQNSANVPFGEAVEKGRELEPPGGVELSGVDCRHSRDAIDWFGTKRQPDG